MAETIALRLSAGILADLRRGRHVRLRLDGSSVVLVRKGQIGRPRGETNLRFRRWWGTGGRPRPGSVAARLLLWVAQRRRAVAVGEVEHALKLSNDHAQTLLSSLKTAGFVRRESRGHYAVTARGLQACPALRAVGRYLKGSHRARVLEWATRRGGLFANSQVEKFLGVPSDSVSLVLGKLVKDGVLRRVSFGVYRAT